MKMIPQAGLFVKDQGKQYGRCKQLCVDDFRQSMSKYGGKNAGKKLPAHRTDKFSKLHDRLKSCWRRAGGWARISNTGPYHIHSWAYNISPEHIHS